MGEWSHVEIAITPPLMSMRKAYTRSALFSRSVKLLLPLWCPLFWLSGFAANFWYGHLYRCIYVGILCTIKHNSVTHTRADLHGHANSVTGVLCISQHDPEEVKHCISPRARWRDVPVLLCDNCNYLPLPSHRLPDQSGHKACRSVHIGDAEQQQHSPWYSSSNLQPSERKGMPLWPHNMSLSKMFK